MQLLPTGIFKPLTPERIKRAAFDAVNQLPGLASLRDEIKPAPRGHTLIREAQYVRGDRIAMMMVAKEPPVDLAGPQFHLNRSDVRHGCLWGPLSLARSRFLTLHALASVPGHLR